MSSWLGAPLAHCACHSYPLMERTLFQEDGLIITVPLCLLSLLSSPTATSDKHNPTWTHHSWGIRERERAVWAKMLYSNKDKQEKERSKAWPGTFEVMGSEREGSKWEFNLEIQASCGYSWLAAVNAAAGRASLISCAVYSRVIIASHYRATARGRLCYQLQSPHHRRLSLITQ